MNIDLDELERLAKAATPGPWTKGDNTFSGFGVAIDALNKYGGLIELCNVVGTKRVDTIDDEGIANAEFIATFNPLVTQELINRLRKAEKDAARYRYLRNTNDCDFNVVDGCGDLYMIDSLDKAIDAAMEQGNG